MRISDWSSDVCSSDLNKLCRIHATPVSAICLARGSPQLVCCCAAQNKRKKHECSSVSARINLPLTPATRESAETRLVQPYRVSLCTRSEEHTSELQSLMRISYAVFCLIKKQNKIYII